MILKRLALALALVTGAALIGALFIAPASAQGLHKGSNVLSFQLSHGDGDFVSTESGGFITSYAHTEWGGQAQFQHLMSEDWGIALSAGVGTFSEKNEPGPSAPLGSQEFEYSQSSWNVRFGLDRYVHLSPTFHLYGGPGLQYWSGTQERDFGAVEDESESVTRVALSGRMGAHISLSESFGLNAHMGHFIGKASADDNGAEASWTPSGNDGAIGVAFHF
ncbi:MAG: outer membrane beta-barrel protein [Candidatus Eisenbacteria bacterium]